MSSKCATAGPAMFDEVPAAGWTQWFLFIGLIEKGLYTYDPTRSPGDYKNAGGPEDTSVFQPKKVYEIQGDPGARCVGRAQWQHHDSW